MQNAAFRCGDWHGLSKRVSAMNPTAIATDDPTVSATFRLPDRCGTRLCYAQRTAPTGERAFGHFIVETRVLAAVVREHIDAPVLADTQPADIALHRWLANPERDDDQPTLLPAAAGDLEVTIEHLFAAGRARVFCSCCNRNVPRAQVACERPPQLTANHAARYFCPEGHLLLGVETGRLIAPAQRLAA
jgi:hypothetical protein